VKRRTSQGEGISSTRKGAATALHQRSTLIVAGPVTPTEHLIAREDEKDPAPAGPRWWRAVTWTSSPCSSPHSPSRGGGPGRFGRPSSSCGSGRVSSPRPAPPWPPQALWITLSHGRAQQHQRPPEEGLILLFGPKWDPPHFEHSSATLPLTGCLFAANGPAGLRSGLTEGGRLLAAVTRESI